MKRIRVFCGSSPAAMPEYARAARELAAANWRKDSPDGVRLKEGDRSV